MLIVYQVIVEVLQLLGPVVRGIERHDRDLARQLRRASTSVLLNVGEGSGTKGGSRMERYRTALGSAPAYLESARAAGFGDEAEAIGERVRAGDLRGAVGLVPDAMADALVMAGSAEHVQARIARYREAGLTGVHLLPSPPGGYYPLYEGHFPVQSLSQLPEFDFPALLESFTCTIELLGDTQAKRGAAT